MMALRIAFSVLVVSLSAGFCCNPAQIRKSRPNCEDVFQGQMEDVRVQKNATATVQCTVNTEMLNNGSAKLYFLGLFPFGKRALYQLIAPRTTNTDPVVHSQVLDSGYTRFNLTVWEVADMYWVECAMWLLQSGSVVAQRAYIGTYPKEVSFDYLRSNIRDVLVSPGDTATFHCQLSYAANFSETRPPTDYITWEHRQWTVYGDWGWQTYLVIKPPSPDRYVVTYDRALHQTTLHIRNVVAGDAGPVKCLVRHRHYPEEMEWMEDVRTLGRSRLAVITPAGVDPWDEVMKEGQTCRVVDDYKWMFTRKPFGPLIELIEGEEMLL